MKRLFSGLCFLIICLGTLIGCNQQQIPENTDGTDQLMSFVDSTFKPTNDFYRFANGKWLLAAEKMGGSGLEELAARSSGRVAELLIQIGKSDELELDDDRKKAADFFMIGLDTVKARHLGSTPLNPFLRRIDQISTVGDLTSYLADKEPYQLNSLFGISVVKDGMSCHRSHLTLVQDGFALPVEAYLDETPHQKASYLRYIGKVMELAKVKYQDSAVFKIYEIEKRLAEVAQPLTQHPDSSELIGLSSLESICPSLDWEHYFEQLDLRNVEHLFTSDSAYIRQVHYIINEYSLAQIKDYLKWHLINEMAPYLSDQFVSAYSEFYGNKLRGEVTSRWLDVLTTVNHYMGGAVGKIYVENELLPDTHKEAVTLVNNIRLSLAEGIKEFDWLSDTAKVETLQHLRGMSVMVGQPSKWADYSAFILDRGTELGSYMQNVMNGRAFEFEQAMQDYQNQSVRNKLMILPHDLRIKYFPEQNSLVVTAVVLQDPLFTAHNDQVINYGGVGTLVGSEMSKVLNQKKGWNLTDSTRYQNFEERFKNQYLKSGGLEDNIELNKVNWGSQINDLVGLKAAMEGYNRYSRDVGIDGKRHREDLRRFFVAWASVLRSGQGSRAYQVNNVLSNVSEFRDAFMLTPLDSLHRPDSLMVNIW